MRVSILSDYDVEIIPLLYSVYGSSSQAHSPSMIEDIFSNLKLDHVPIYFPTLSEVERRIVETIL